MILPRAGLQAANTVGGQVIGATGSSVMNPWIRDFEYAINSWHRTVYPSAGDLLRQYHSGRLTFKSLQVVMGFYGINVDNAVNLDPEYQSNGQMLDVGKWYGVYEPDQWVNAVQVAGWSPPLSMIFDMYNRGLVTRELCDWWIWRLGIRDPYLRQHLLYMRRDIPQPHELVRMLAYINSSIGWASKKYGLHNGYDTSAQNWLASVGVGKVTIVDKATGQPETLDAGLIAWEQQWDWPATSDATQMLFRLRPTGGPGGGPRDPSGEVFDIADAEPVFRQHRLPDYWVKKTIAISHRPLSRFQIAKALLYGHITVLEAKECFLDLGYNDRDADLMARQTDRDVRLKATFHMLDVNRSKIEDAYRTGTIDDQEAIALMEQLGFTVDEATQAVLAMRLEIQNAVTKAAVSHITTHVCHGVISASEGQIQLQQLGITPDAQSWKMQEWAACITSPHKELTAGNICKLMSDGFISVSVALIRLANLGFSLLDSEAFLLPCIAGLEAKLRKAAIDVIRSKEKAAKEAAKAIKDAKEKVKQDQAELARHSGPSLLKRWLSDNLIGPAEALSRLSDLGWPLDDSQRLVEEGLAVWKVKQEKANAKAKKA